MKQNNYLFYSNDPKLYNSAKEIYTAIQGYLPKVESIVEVGCGMAALSKIFQEKGVKKITLIDHPKLDVSQCLIKDDFQFIACDFDKELPKQLRADLVICTEVLEHLKKDNSLKLLDYLTSIADVIIFSAAVPKQPGTGHINTQFHSFWINEFKQRGFDYSDRFKSSIINNDHIYYWLRQNLFIFFRNQPENSPLQNAKWLNNDFSIINNELLERPYYLLEALRIFCKSAVASVKNRVTKVLNQSRL